MTVPGTRGQAYTLEGIISAVLVIVAVLLGLQAVNVAPWTSGPTEQSVETLRTQANDLLSAAADDGTLRQAVTCVDDGTPNVDAYRPTKTDSSTALGPMFGQTLGERGYEYNIYIRYWDAGDSPRDGTDRAGKTTTEPVYPDEPQEPDSSVVTATQRVVLYNSTMIRTGDDCSAAAPLNNDTDFYADSVYQDSPIYTVVEVRVETW